MPALAICGTPASGMPGSPSRLADPQEPAVRATDLGLTRGDGVFESVGIHHGRMHDLEPHLARLAQSAAMLGMPPPDLGAFRDTISLAVRALLDGLDPAPRTAMCKVVYTRGDEGAAATRPFGYAYAEVFPDTTLDQTEGVAVITLTRGHPLGIGARAPWLLIGAKTLSYAVNMAALRHAASKGAQDVIFTTTDDYVLEAPRSTVLARVAGTVVTPAVDGGLLHGTAQRAAFDAFTSLGLTTEYRDLRVEELRAADEVWLTDSVQLLRPVRLLDDEPRTFDAGLTAAVLAGMLAGG